MKKISCKINDDFTLELRDVKEVMGHDDSLPFNAYIYLRKNGSKRANYVGYAYNDGWGGDTCIRCEEKKHLPAMQSLSNYIRQFSVPYTYGGRTNYLPASLSFLIDLMVEVCLYNGTTEYDFSKNFIKAA